jgi:hypothetical protein
MTKQLSRGEKNNTLLSFEKPAAEYDDDNDDCLTTPTAAPSQSLDSIDDAAALLEEDQYQASKEGTNDAVSRQTTVVDFFPPQSSDVFRSATTTTTTNNNISIAPTFPSHGVLGRFDSDYGDEEESQDVEDGDEESSSSFLGDDDDHDDETPSEDEREEQDGAEEAVSSLPHAIGGRVSGGNNINSSNSGAFMPQSFRPFQSRNSQDNPMNVDMTDIPTTKTAEATDTSNNNNNTTPQCRHTPSIITSSEASYIFQQLDELRTAPSGITYSQPKYLQPTNIISGNKFADSLPIDAIHAISSYCDGKSWMALCHTSKQWRGVGYEVWRKVRLHAFRCAGEVLFAWVS